MTASVNLSAPLVQKFWDNAGNVASGCKLFTYGAGTNTKQPVYTDSTGLVPCTNPILLDATGSATFWPDTSLTYKFVLAPANDTDPPTSPIWTRDGVATPANTVQAAAAAAAAAQPYVNAASTSATSAAGSATAAQNALTAQNIFANTTAGLAGTTSGEYFAIPSGTSGGYLDLYLNSSGSASFVNTYPSLSAINTYIDSVTKGAYLFGQQVGTFALGTSGNPITGTAFAAHTYVLAAPVPKSGALTAVQFWATGAGSVKIKRFDGSYAEVSNVTLACVTGLNTYNTKDIGSLPVSAGDSLGYYSTVSVQVSGKDLRSAYFDGGAGDLTNPAHTAVATSLAPQIQMTVSYTATDASGVAANNAIVSRFRDEARVTYRLGSQDDTIGTGTGVAGTGHTLFLEPMPRTGRITKFRANLTAADYVTLYAWDRSGDTLTRRSSPLDVFRMPLGYSEMALDDPMEPGVYLSAQSGNFRLDSGSRFPGRGYQSVAGASTTALLDGSALSSTAAVPMFAFELECDSYVHQVQKHRVTIGRTDSIGVLGNSFLAGAYHPYKKTPIAMASQMSAWDFRNFSVTSQDVAGRLAAIRSGACDFFTNISDGNNFGTSSDGATYRDYRAAYVLIPLATNSASAAALQASMHDEMETVRATGATPLFITEVAPNTFYQAAIFRQFAQKYDGLYLGDLTSILTKFPQTQAAFDRAGHKAYRVTSAHYAQSIVRAVEAFLGAPRSGFKMFRPRPGFSYSVAADLMYDAIDDLRNSLSTKWQEIEVGGGFVTVGDANIGYMDAISSTGSYTTTSQRYSEYDTAQIGHSLAFTDFALMSFHLDAQPQQIREVRVFVGTGHTAVYARSPFTAPTAVYSAGAYPSAGGQQGFWHSLPLTSDGWAIVREWEVSGKLSNTGRMDFLVEHSGAFTLQRPELVWWGEGGKTRAAPVSLLRPKGAELIGTPKPYAAGSLAAGWTSTGSPSFANTANGGDLPAGCTGYARLTSADTISFAITGIGQPSDPYDGREIEVGIWCCSERALVVGATYPTGASMTNDTWDAEQINVSNVNASSGDAATVAKTLMPYWQEVRIKSWLVAGQTAATVKLGCATTGAVLVARASCKLVEG